MNLIRTYIGLIIIVTMLPLCMMAFDYIGGIKLEYREIDDEIALFQLRECLLISYDLHYSPERLDFRYEGSPFRLSLVNDKLILQPGTQIYLDGIESLSFDRRGEMIYVVYQRSGKEYERIIASTKGIHLDDFSDCDVSDHEPGDGNE